MSKRLLDLTMIKGAELPFHQHVLHPVHRSDPPGPYDTFTHSQSLLFPDLPVSPQTESHFLSFYNYKPSTQLFFNGHYSQESYTTGVKFNRCNTNSKASAHIGAILEDLQSFFLKHGHLSQDIFIKLIRNPAYLSFLNHVPDRDLIRRCGIYGDEYRDENGHVGYRPILCRNRNSCIIDSNTYTAGLADDVFELFRTISDTWRNNTGVSLYYITDTFTLPENVAARIYELGHVGDKILRDAILEFKRLSMGGLPAIQINHQFWHSWKQSGDNPLRGPFVHVHTDELNLTYRKDARLSESFPVSHTLNNFRTVNPYVDVDLMRSIWYGCLTRLCSRIGVQLEAAILNGDKQLVWNREYIEFNSLAYTELKNGIKKSNYNLIKHRLYYNMRKPLIDIIKYFEDLGTAPQLPNSEKNFMLNVLLHPPRDKKLHVWGGWLADGVKNKYLALLSLHVKNKKEIKEELSDFEKKDAYVCPVCGATMDLHGEGELSYVFDVPSDSIILTESMRVDYVRLERVTKIDSGRHPPSLEDAKACLRKVLDAMNKTVQPEPKEVLVTFLVNVPAFVGLNGRVYGPYAIGDLDVLPEIQAKALISKGAAW